MKKLAAAIAAMVLACVAGCDPKSSQPAPQDTGTPYSVVLPAPTPDRRFPTCRQAKAAGYGPYFQGDIEFDWYEDADHDGKVCD